MWRRIAALLLFGGLWFYVALFAESPVSIRILQRAGMAPHTMEAVLTVPKDSRTREICLEWWKDGEDFGSSSCATAEGEAASITHRYRRVIREAGTWYFRGVVRRSNSIERSVALPVIVGGFDGSR